MVLRFPSGSDALAVSKMRVPTVKTAPFVGWIQLTIGSALVGVPLVTLVTPTSTNADTPRAPALSTASARNWCIPTGGFVQLN